MLPTDPTFYVPTEPSKIPLILRFALEFAMRCLGILLSSCFLTVDGSEIRLAPIEVGSLFHYIVTWFYTSQVVVWDFFHQQYGTRWAMMSRLFLV